MLFPDMELHYYLEDIRKLVTFPNLAKDQDKINSPLLLHRTAVKIDLFLL